MSVKQLRRVLLTGDTEGGVWTFVLELAQGLLQREIEVCLVTFGPSVNQAQEQSAAAIEGLNWFHHKSKLEWMQDPWSDIQRAGQFLQEVARNWIPDLVHLNTLCHGELAWGAPVIITHHSCVLSWWQAVKRSPLPEEWRRYQQEVEHSLQCATAISAPTKSALMSVVRNYRIDPAEAYPIYNGRSFGVFRNEQKQEIVLSAGRLWDEGKNISALAGLGSRLPWPVYLAGESHNLNGVDIAFDGCHFLGKLSTPELAGWYAKAAIYALPARYEPFGLSILEAALSGCALVLGDIPSLREIWNDAAIFVSTGQDDALEPALRLLIENSSLRDRLSRRALQRAREFTQARMIDGYLSLYEIARARYQERAGRHACAS
ncbi:MAG TPA: glycosyltransferase family 4 protein [Bryobacteraceae bacterium]|jgi:glycosyltransferase involved in cell wall biosynthesis|nr:glycosyltransferase family 4 protein [Bryobacteraceae bacterium]